MSQDETRSRNLTLIRFPRVRVLTGGSKAGLYKAMAEQRFPLPVKIGKRAVAWVEAEVLDWIESRIDARDGVTQ